MSEKYPGKILRWGNLLALKLENGLFVWLIGMEGDYGGFGCCEAYRLQDYWPDAGTYVVALDRDEIRETLLVSERTADFAGVSGTTYRNPSDGKWFVSIDDNDMNGWSMEVWEMAGLNWRRLYDCPSLAYGTKFVRWSGPRTVELANEQDSARKDTLSLVDGKWESTACNR